MPWSFEPSVLFQAAELTDERAIDINLKTYYKLRQGRLWAGFSYRNSFEGAQYLDGQLLKRQRLQLITPLIGIDYKDFISSNEGEVVLIVGHSNTIPNFVNELINDQVYDQIDDLNNSNLYIVNLCDSSISHRLIKVN